nr:hypothetical protein [Tanacetum cinerariifolium]
PTSPSPSSPVIPSSPPHQSPCPPQPQATEGSSHVFQQVLDTCSVLVLRVEGLETANAAQQLEIIKLQARVKKLERLNKVKSSKLRRLRKVGTSQRVESLDDVENVFNQGRMSVDMETDEGVELVVDQEKNAKIEGRQADKQAEIYNIDLDHFSKIAVVAPAVSTRRRKGVVIRDPEEELHTDTPAETPTVKDKGKGILIEDPKPMKKKDQVEMDAEVKKLERLNKVKSSKLRRLKKVGTSQRIESSEDEENVFNQGRISVDIDEGIELVDDQEKDARVKGRQADTQAEIYNIDLDHTFKVLSMQEDTEVQEVVEVVNAAKLMTEVATTAASIPIPAAEPVVVAISAAKPAAKPKVLRVVPAAPVVSTRKRKGVVIRDPEEELHDDTPAET